MSGSSQAFPAREPVSRGETTGRAGAAAEYHDRGNCQRHSGWRASWLIKTVRTLKLTVAGMGLVLHYRCRTTDSVGPRGASRDVSAVEEDRR